MLGLVLALGGILSATVAWFILAYMPLVALGISAVILGAVSLALGKSLPRISPDASLILLEAGLENIAALTEELGLRGKAMYLPSFLTNDRPRAVIPFHNNDVKPVIQWKVEKRLIVRFGPGPDDYGILVATPGSQALGLLEVQNRGSTGDFESELSGLLVGTLDLANSVRVSRNGDSMTVDVGRPLLTHRGHSAYSILGSPIASIVAAVAAESLGRPVSVMGETGKGHHHLIELELQPEVTL